jgi:transglutaminase-like putative cysteine protease
MNRFRRLTFAVPSLLSISLCLLLAGCAERAAGGTAADEKSGTKSGNKAGGTNESKTTINSDEPAKTTGEYRLDAGLPYLAKRSNPITHDVDFSVVVTPPYQCKLLKVWLPLAQSDVGQEVGESQLDTFPLKVEAKINTEPVYGNRFAYFEFTRPEGAQIIRNRFKVKVWDLHWNVDPRQVTAVEKWPESFAVHLQPQKISQQEAFEQVLRQVVPKRTDPAQDMFVVMEWIDKNMKYDHVKASLRADADHAFTQRCGHCSDYHGLCATMGRTLGHPTRITYGVQLFPKNSPSHCRFEAFMPPYGWVSFDLAETQKLVQAIAADKNLSDEEKARLTQRAKDRNRRGFRENSWLLVTKGYDYDLVPKASQRVPVVRTIYAEADGQPLPDPDPANKQQKGFAWMTVHQYKADKKISQPFKDLSTLEGAE